MSISVTFNSAHRVLLASEFFMARRPVVDREQRLVAHELMFCNAHDRHAAHVAPADRTAAAPVIADVTQHGMERVIDGRAAILYIDADALMSDIFRFLPADRMVLELASMPVLKPVLLDRLAELQAEGFHFALAVEEENDGVRAMLPLVEGVRINVNGKSDAQLCKTFRAHGKKLLAERVDTPERFNTCFELGFDFFQGYYFTQPVLASGTNFLPMPSAITAAMDLLASEADNATIEAHIRENTTLGLNLLRRVNKAAAGEHPVDSLRQALMVVGRSRLREWLQALLNAGPSRAPACIEPLLALTTTRGRLVELLAQKLKPGNRSVADTGFTVGVMSLMDALFSTPMEEILQTIPVNDDIRDALLSRQGYFGKLLSLAEYTEWKDKNDAPLTQLLQELGLSYNDLYLLQLAAFEWSDSRTPDIL